VIDGSRWPYTDVLFARCMRKSSAGRIWACDACGFDLAPGALYMSIRYSVADDVEVQYGRHRLHDGCFQVQQSAWHMVGALPGELLDVQTFLRRVGESWLTGDMPFRPTRSSLSGEAFWNHTAAGFRPLPAGEKDRLFRVIDAPSPPLLPRPFRWHKGGHPFRSDGLIASDWLKKYGNVNARERFARGPTAEDAAWMRLRQLMKAEDHAR
jgi:hypothetical protein